MQSIFASPDRAEKGISRRHFLTAGALGMGGLTLADLLRAEAAAGIKQSNKAVINIHLDGGPPQMDLIDLKPHAPAEIRGEFTSIATALSGMRVCEHMPKIAGIAEQLVFIRSLVGSAGRHDAFQCQSGFDSNDVESIGGRPVMGSVVARLRGSTKDVAPPFVDLMQGRPLVRNSARPGFLGPAYQPFRPDISQLFSRPLEDGMKKELAALGADHSIQLTLNDSLTAARLQDRTQLLDGLDRVRRQIDSSGMMDALDRFTQQAVGILTSGRLARALDLSDEDPRNLARYTLPNGRIEKPFETSDDASAVRKFLLARRLIEAGVRCVSISISDFDTHSENFSRLRQILPIFDRGLWALVTDLQERGLLDDVSIVAWGEFGRTPRIDAKTTGRHHWPRVGMAMLAGGGMRVGQVIGETDRTAGSVTSRPVHYQDVFATLYRNLGFNLSTATVTDPRGRPHYLVETGKPIAELG